jgi:hypothetical protein
MPQLFTALDSIPPLFVVGTSVIASAEFADRGAR